MCFYYLHSDMLRGSNFILVLLFFVVYVRNKQALILHKFGEI